MALIIGFSNVMFTLWDVQEHNSYTTDSWGNHHLSSSWVQYTYLKNVSKSREKVIELYPDLTINEEIRGTKSYEVSIYEDKYSPEVFSKGFLSGTLISECSDISNLKWSYWAERNSERCDNILKQMESLGYFFVSEYNCWFTKEELAEKQRKETEREQINKLYESEVKRINELYNSYESGGEIEIEMDRNLTEYGVIALVSDLANEHNFNGYDVVLRVKFEDYVVNYYNGYGYGLPAIKGKGKRVKGKTLVCQVVKGTQYYPSEDLALPCLVVKSFTIKK